MLPTRIVLGGASRRYREHVRACIQACLPHSTVVGEAPGPAGAALVARRTRADVVMLFDDSPEAAAKVLEACSRRPFVVLVPARMPEGPVPDGVLVLPSRQFTVQGAVLRMARVLMDRRAQRDATSRGSGN